MASASFVLPLSPEAERRSERATEARHNRWPEILLLLISAAVYFWDLANNGWGNPYYAAAAQAGATDLESYFFGAADAGNGLTVDKPPLHLWILGLSVKLFGLSYLSVLVPQALMGMATVLLVHRTVAIYGTVRQAFLAGLFLILTPVTTIIFRFNNPDALLLLLWALAAFFFIKSVHKQSTAHLYLAAFVLGMAFLCKQFQSWIIVPAIATAFLLFGFGHLLPRLGRLACAAMVMVLPPGIWIITTELTPAAHRPWVGGSVGNSFLELTFGYNGLGRLTGQTGLGAANPKDFEGVVGYDAGILRLLTINYAPEVAWFLPVAFVGAIGLLAGLCRRKQARAQALIAVFVLGWFAATFGVLSFMTGDIHPYYTCMLAIPMAILSSQAAETLWVNRAKAWHRRGAALVTLVSILITSGILTWFEGWLPWAGFTAKALALGASAILGLWLGSYRPNPIAVAYVLAGSSLVLVPFLFILESINTPQQGSFPISGPVPAYESWHRRDAEQLRLNEQAKYSQARGEPVVREIALRLESTPLETRWAAATTGSQNAALYQLATGRPVMSIGGFSTSDIFPLIGDFKEFVQDHEITYYIHQPGILEWANASENTREVVSWIESNFEYEEIGGVRVYDMRRLSS